MYCNSSGETLADTKIKIDVGCGANCKPGFLGIDREKWTSDVKYKCDFEHEKLPFKNSTVDSAYCCHVLEHLDNPMSLVDEVYRVLKPHGDFVIRVPHYSYPASHVMNHKNYWSFHCKQHFDGGYHEYTKWSKVNFVGKFANSNGFIEKILGFLLKKHPFAYETFLSNFYPIAEIEISLVK